MQSWRAGLQALLRLPQGPRPLMLRGQAPAPTRARAPGPAAEGFVGHGWSGLVGGTPRTLGRVAGHDGQLKVAGNDAAGRCWRPRPRPSPVALYNAIGAATGLKRAPPLCGDGGCLHWQPPASKAVTGGGVADRGPLIQLRIRLA